MAAYFVELAVVQKILSDPVWRLKAKAVKGKEEMRTLLLEFCRERGRVIRLDQNTFLLHVD